MGLKVKFEVTHMGRASETSKSEFVLLKQYSFSWYCVRPVKGRLVEFIKPVFLVGCTKWSQ